MVSSIQTYLLFTQRKVRHEGLIKLIVTLNSLVHRYPTHNCPAHNCLASKFNWKFTPDNAAQNAGQSRLFDKTMELCDMAKW